MSITSYFFLREMEQHSHCMHFTSKALQKPFFSETYRQRAFILYAAYRWRWQTLTKYIQSLSVLFQTVVFTHLNFFLAVIIVMSDMLKCLCDSVIIICSLAFIGVTSSSPNDWERSAVLSTVLLLSQEFNNRSALLSNIILGNGNITLALCKRSSGTATSTSEQLLDEILKQLPQSLTFDHWSFWKLP